MTKGKGQTNTFATPIWQVMGIVNMTPDSFYDGGRINGSVSQAYDFCAKLIDEGATILDIGGESTRPGSLSISADEEINRVVPLIEKLSHSFDIPLSIDTTKSVVARAAIEAGVVIVNDISAGRFDSAMPSVVAQHNVSVVLMHSRKRPVDMQESPHYKDSISEVQQELLASVTRFTTQGVDPHAIILDPGIGFAKSVTDNITLLAHTDALVSLGYPVLIGTSRKSFIGALTQKESSDRLAGSLATIGETYRQGATLFRVHDVAATVDYLKVLSAIVERSDS